MRNPWLIRLVFLSLIALSALTQTVSPSPAAKVRWYKGNLHTHTLNSDGDSSPDEVTRWYRDRGYNFLLLSDHNRLTDAASLNAVYASKEQFLLLQGEEVTDSYLDKPIHVNAYDLDTELQPKHGDSVAATIQNNVDSILAAKALPSINHPNYQWAITAEDLLRVENLRLMEVYNGHPTVNNVGGGGFRSLEEMWDVLLTAGRRINGIAVDDAHGFKKFGREFSNPGRGWIQVRAESLTAAAIRGAIEKGQFYASTGVNLADIQVSAEEYRIEIDPRSTEKFTTYFIGSGGKVLAKTFDTRAVYRFTGAEKYVRARVESSFGLCAWTQPVFRP